MAIDETDGTLPASQRMEELGTSGLKGARPREGWLYQEFLPQLRGLQGAVKFREMADNDAIIGAALFAFKMLLRTVKWDVTAADDSDAAQEAKAWVESVLFQDLPVPFSDVVGDILSFLHFGFAPVEVVYKVRKGANDDPTKSSISDDGTIGVAKLAVRSQETVWRWHFDPVGDVLGMEQFILGAPNVIIPRDKLLLFRTDPSLNNPEGRSLLRNCYILYLRKNLIEEAEGRAAIRSAGIVSVKIPGKFLDVNASGDERVVADAYKALADKLAQDRMGSVVLPSDLDPTTKAPLYELAYVVADGRRPTDMTTIIERYDKRMLSTMLADFILLGQQSVGSFALSDSKTALFSKACQAFLGIIGDQFNRVLLGRLWTLNQFDPEYKPTVSPSDLEVPDLSVLGAFITSIATAGAQVFPNPELENKLLNMAGLPNTVEQG